MAIYNAAKGISYIPEAAERKHDHSGLPAHGLRTTASTLLNESGKWSPDAIERSLAHADKNSIRGIYNRGRYWDERVAMHQWWSDYLDQLRSGNVRPHIEAEDRAA